MWIPTTVKEIESAVKAGILQERATVDIKRVLPIPARNVEVAIDVAAMATAGGTLIYGIGEDAKKRPELDPIVLAGARERIASIVQSSLAEPPVLDTKELPLENDPARGYLVVHIPTSPLAPHMVQVKGEYRYYGRNEAGNYILPHAQVIALLERRRRWQEGWEELLDQAIADGPNLKSLPDFVPLDLILEPILAEKDLLERASPGGGRTILNRVTETANALRFKNASPQSLTSVIGSPPLQRIDGWMLHRDSEEDDAKATDYACQLEVGDSGRVRFFHAGMARTYSTTNYPKPTKRAHDHAIAQLTAQVILFAGRLYEAAGYSGPVIAAVSIRTEGDVLSSRSAEIFGSLGGWPYARENYRRGARWLAAYLVQEPREAAIELVGPWLRALRQDDPRTLLRLASDSS